MKLLGKPLAAALPEGTDTSEWGDYWYTPYGDWTKTGITITDDIAMRIGAFQAGVRLISETLGMLPVFMYRRLEGKAKELALDHPLHDRLHTAPNDYQDAMAWKEIMTAHAIMWGNGYSRVWSGARGPIDRLVPLDPRRVDCYLAEDGRLRFTVEQEFGGKKTLLQQEVFHLRGFGYGIKGLSLLSAMRETLGLAIAAEEHAARFYANAAEPGGFIEMDGHLKSKEDRERLQESFDRKYSGLQNRFRTMLLEYGMKWKPAGMSHKDAEFIMSRKFQVTEIARWLRLPPHMLADLERATFSNIETQDLEFVKFSILPWVKRWESGIANQLLIAPQRYFAEFNLEMLLRADIETRMKSYQIAITNGILSRNEVRELENRNPYEGGDDFLMPLNMTTARRPDGGEVLILKRGEDYFVYDVDSGGRIVNRNGVALDTELMPGAPPAPARLPAQAESIVRAASERILRKEIAQVSKLAKRHGDAPEVFQQSVRKFYGDHVGYVSEHLALSEAKAKQYCARQIGELLIEGVAVIEGWPETRADELTELALET